jgi:hypothetical protein
MAGTDFPQPARTFLVPSARLVPLQGLAFTAPYSQRAASADLR